MNVLMMTYHNCAEENVISAWEKVGITNQGSDQQHLERNGKAPHIEDEPEVDDIVDDEAQKTVEVIIAKSLQGGNAESDKQRLFAFLDRVSGDNHTEYYSYITEMVKGVEKKM